MYKIDVKHQVEEMERVLRAHADGARCQATLTVLRRWQFDEMLDDGSREKAKMLVLEFDWSPETTGAPQAWSAAGAPAVLPGKLR